MDAKLRASRERPHGSAGGEGIRRHRMRFSVTSRHPGSVEQPPARLRGTMGNGSTGQMRSSNPPPGCGALWGMAQLGKCARATPRQAAGRLARGSANLGLESGLTERRTLRHSSRGAITQGAPFREERRHPPEAHSAPVDFSNAQSRSSQPTLPLGPERSCSARSPPSGSVRRTARRL